MEQETRDQVWQWMLAYQEKNGRLAKMEEIKEARPTLNWRSSVRHNLQVLLKEGRVEVVDDPGTARRYRALPLSPEEELWLHDADEMTAQFVPFQEAE